MLADGYWITVLVFVGVGAAVQGFQNASMNLTLEFGDREDLPVRIALANMASEVAGTIGPSTGWATGLRLCGIMKRCSLTSVAFLTVGGDGRYESTYRNRGNVNHLTKAK